MSSILLENTKKNHFSALCSILTIQQWRSCSMTVYTVICKSLWAKSWERLLIKEYCFTWLLCRAVDYVPPPPIAWAVCILGLWLLLQINCTNKWIWLLLYIHLPCFSVCMFTTSSLPLLSSTLWLYGGRERCCSAAIKIPRCTVYLYCF